MRMLLVILLMNGLVHAFAEGVETAVHYARAGHVAHGRDDAEQGCDVGREHGCSTTEHRCLCCPGMPFVARARSSVSAPAESIVAVPPRAVGILAARSLEPPFRPPIA